PLQVLLLMTGITLLPAALLGLTAFTRIIIVLGLLRQALGTGQTPSNQVLLALALFLTVMVMMPVFDSAWVAGISPYLNDQMEFRQAWTAALEPFRGFMLAQVRENDLMTFANLSGTGPYATGQDVPFGVLAASFLTSELKTAFEIAFLVYIPFVIIDLVVASVLMSMGMMMLSPMLVSAPFKILLFVLVDGWALIVGSLARSFNPIRDLRNDSRNRTRRNLPRHADGAHPRRAGADRGAGGGRGGGRDPGRHPGQRADHPVRVQGRGPGGGAGHHRALPARAHGRVHHRPVPSHPAPDRLRSWRGGHRLARVDGRGRPVRHARRGAVVRAAGGRGAAGAAGGRRPRHS